MSEYIDRQAASDALAGLCKRVCQYSEKQRQYMCGACPLGDAFTVIEDDLPAADVRPVLRGEWWKSLNPGFSPFDDSGEYRYRCNRCGHTQNCELNFCPHCGADMREPPKEESYGV